MKKYLLLTIYLLLPTTTQAHCPLCTVGAGALAVAAASVGVSTPTVGVFIGGFALALSLWIAKLIKKKYCKYQDLIVIFAIFFSTIIPIIPFIKEYRSLYISFFGEYGSTFHNTYIINLYLLGAVVGAFLLFISPYISQKISQARGKTFPYQGLSLTFLLLVIAGVIFQITI